MADHDRCGFSIHNAPIGELERPTTQRGTLGIQKMHSHAGIPDDFDE
jgi:hypothetical protein